MSNLESLAIKMLESNPNVRNTPMGQKFIEALRSGDSKAIETLGRNICKSQGKTEEEAYRAACQFFGLK